MGKKKIKEKKQRSKGWSGSAVGAVTMATPASQKNLNKE